MIDRLPSSNLPTALSGSNLTSEDQETLAHLLRSGVGENSLRAMRSDLDYLEAWSLACDATPLPWPPDRNLLLRFIAHHLWDEDEHEVNPDHGMPEAVRAILERGGYLRVNGPHAPATVRRRMSTWRSLCKWREAGDPFDDPIVKKTLSAAVRTSKRARKRKSAKPVTADIIGRIIDKLSPLCAALPYQSSEMDRIRITALRDRAMLCLAFASGGRRRSEISNLMIGDIEFLDPMPDPDDGRMIEGVEIHLRRTKTTDSEDDPTVYMNGLPVRFLRAWLESLDRENGPVFCAINRWGQLSQNGIGAASLNDILKKRLAEIGEDPDQFSAHGLRSGFITEAFDRNVPAHDVMGQTLHRSISTAMAYYNQQNRRKSQATRLLD